jgi:ferredoxin-NADP reductase
MNNVQIKTTLMSGLNDSPLIDVRLAAIHYAAHDINIYELSRPDDIKLPATQAGAHVDLHLPNGLVRQYSIFVPDLSPTRYALAIKREAISRGGSRYIFDELKVGALLRISEPVNRFRLNDGAAHSILIAGGIGITPIWAMAKELQADDRSWELHYACRSRPDMAFHDPLKRLANVRFYFGNDETSAALDLESIVSHAPKHAHLYCCGPARMLNSFEDVTSHWPSDQVHLERFAAKEKASLEGGFVVELARSGGELIIPPNKSILTVLRDAGVDVPYSCEDGVCGACVTSVISGVPDHRDSVLSKAEREANKSMMICCSGCRDGRLILDL